MGGVNTDWLVPPERLDTRHAMAIETAGLAAMLGVMALEQHGVSVGQTVLITRSSGRVGSLATTILADRDYEVAAVTGRSEGADYLRGLGASMIMPRDELNKTIRKPLESERLPGCIDTVVGPMLARVSSRCTMAGPSLQLA